MRAGEGPGGGELTTGTGRPGPVACPSSSPAKVLTGWPARKGAMLAKSAPGSHMPRAPSAAGATRSDGPTRQNPKPCRRPDGLRLSWVSLAHAHAGEASEHRRGTALRRAAVAGLGSPRQAHAARGPTLRAPADVSGAHVATSHPLHAEGHRWPRRYATPPHTTRRRAPPGRHPAPRMATTSRCLFLFRVSSTAWKTDPT